MCNACGFYCCADDGFAGCGCDNCPEPVCWSEEDENDCFEDDDVLYADDTTEHRCDLEACAEDAADG